MSGRTYKKVSTILHHDRSRDISNTIGSMLVFSNLVDIADHSGTKYRRLVSPKVVARQEWNVEGVQI